MTLKTPAFNDAVKYGFEWLRYISEVGDVKEGVVNGGDFAVTAAAGGGMKVDVAAGAAFVKGDSGVASIGLSQGLYLAVNDASIANAVTLAASDPTNPRLDQICLRVRDSNDLGTGADDATLVVVTGTATAGATLDTRNGALALPNDYLRLADVLVPAASVATTAGNIRDRRPWARGAYSLGRRANLADLSVTSVGAPGAVIDATRFSFRLELTGAPVRWRFSTRIVHSAAAEVLAIYPRYDGGFVPGDTGSDGHAMRHPTGLGGHAEILNDFVPTAPSNAAGASSTASGSHLIQAFGWVTSGTGTIVTSGNNSAIMTVEELVRQNANNGIV